MAKPVNSEQPLKPVNIKKPGVQNTLGMIYALNKQNIANYSQKK